MDSELRRSVVNFGQGFMTGTIAGAAIRKNRSAEQTNILRDKLLTFYGCHHQFPLGFVFHVLPCSWRLQNQPEMRFIQLLRYQSILLNQHWSQVKSPCAFWRKKSHLFCRTLWK